MNQNRFDIYQFVTETILSHLERGVVPWRQPWASKVGRPRNFHSDRPYQGINVLLLGLHRFASPFWMTFEQVQRRGGRVRKGEHGAQVVKYGRYESQDDNGKKQLRYYLKGYKVFNAAQIESIDFPALPKSRATPLKKRLSNAEAIVSKMPLLPRIEEGRSVRACYHPKTDFIEVPERATFDGLEQFYLTLFHELVHATGHASRLNRSSLTENDGFGGQVYSFEELVAEMGSAFLGVEANIVSDDHEQSAAYLDGWLSALKDKDHRRWIVQAASLATHAADFILDRANTEAQPIDGTPTGS
ncbi:MAG: zincin-like metallopeptidase domain-containing protein [Chthoniobacteraceae bacterium]